jgi:hypothetical protein
MSAGSADWEEEEEEEEGDGVGVTIVGPVLAKAR